LSGLQIAVPLSVAGIPYQPDSDTFFAAGLALRGDMACLLGLEPFLVTFNGTVDLQVSPLAA
jgi:hypothetical protein